MNILIYGAGVLGSRYGAALSKTANKVTILARGERAAFLRKNGIVLEEVSTGAQSITPVYVTEEFTPEDEYDLVIVLMRSNQAQAILPILAANEKVPTYLFLGNNVTRTERFVEALGHERVLIGFAGAAGTREGQIIHYLDSGEEMQGLTYAGELDGSITPRLEQIQNAFNQTEFPLEIHTQMDAWLKTHAALILPLAFGVYMAGGDNYRLAATRDVLVLIIRAIQEGFKALKAKDIDLVPRKFALLKIMPEPILVAFAKKLMNSKGAEIGVAGHANAARDEMNDLAAQLMNFIDDSGVSTPSLNCLLMYQNPKQPPMTEGSSHISLRWEGLILFLLGLGAFFASIYALLGRLLRKQEE